MEEAFDGRRKRENQREKETKGNSRTVTETERYRKSSGLWRQI